MRDMGIGVKRNIRDGIVVAHEEGPDAQVLVHEIEYHLALRSRHAVGERALLCVSGGDREPAEDTVVPRLDHQGSGGISIRHGYHCQCCVSGVRDHRIGLRRRSSVNSGPGVG